MLAQAGRLPESLALFEESERLFDIAGLPLGELHAEAADAMLDLRLLPEARVAADRALREFIESDVPLMRAEAQLRVARVALLADDAEVAVEASRKAVEAFRRQRRTGWAARSAVVGVEARLVAGTATHADLLEVRRAAATLERLGQTSEAVDAHLTAGRTATLLDRDAWALASFGRAQELARGSSVLTRLRGRLAAASAAALRGEPGVAVRPLSPRTGRPRPAPRPARVDRAARARLGSRRRARAAGPPRPSGNLVAGEGVRLDGAQPGDRPPVGAARRVDGFAEEFELLREMTGSIEAGGGASEALVARRAALEQRLRRLTWGRTGAEDARTRRTPTRELQALLGDRVLVEYGVLDGEVLAAVVTGAGWMSCSVAPLVSVRQEPTRSAFLLRTMARRAGHPSGANLVRLARERVASLRRILVDPLALPRDQELVVVPVDVLQSVPWSALVDAPVSLSPSASFWASARQRSRPASGKVLLAAGPGLPAAEGEVLRLGRLHEHSEVLSPPESTVRRVAEALEDAEHRPLRLPRRGSRGQPDVLRSSAQRRLPHRAGARAARPRAVPRGPRGL